MTAHWNKQKIVFYRCCSIYIISPALYITSHFKKTLHQKLLFFEVLFLARSNNTQWKILKDFSKKSKKKSQKFPIISCLVFNIFVTDMGKPYDKHIVDDKLANHLNSTKVSWYFQKILSLAQVVKYTLHIYTHIIPKNDIVNCDNFSTRTFNNKTITKYHRKKKRSLRIFYSQEIFNFIWLSFSILLKHFIFFSNLNSFGRVLHFQSLQRSN